MKAMILAAGRGERMGAFSNAVPKPMLVAGGKPLIQYHLENLAAAGITDIVINVSWLGEQIEGFVGDGKPWGCRVEWSREPEALETAGGILQALPLLGDGPFAVVNGDVWTDFPLGQLLGLEPGAGACLVMVDNPPHHPEGDFALREDGPDSQPDLGGHFAAAGSSEVRQAVLVPKGQYPSAPALTYAGLGVYSPDFFEGVPEGVRPLRPLLDNCMARGQLTGVHYPGRWSDVGTPARLAALDDELTP